MANSSFLGLRLHREGHTLLKWTGLGVLALNSLLFLLLVPGPAALAAYIVLGVTLLLFLLLTNFFRDPVRPVPVDDYHILAPCDGRVVAVEQVVEKRYFNRKVWQVSIFMSPLNVHVNRNPTSGKVLQVEHREGKFHAAFHPKSSEENEHTYVVLRHRGEDIVFKQIAGAVARRISCYIEPNTFVYQGHEMGFIKFGSRMDIFFSLEAKPVVKLGQRTRGGQTTLAKYKLLPG